MYFVCYSLDNESCQHVTNQYYQKYADLVDTAEEDGGLISNYFLK